jgi:catalase
MGPDYLADEIANEFVAAPSSSHCSCKCPRETTRPMIPRSRGWTPKKDELGTIPITKAVADIQTAEEKLLFMPGAVVPGIEAADPMIAARVT